MAKSGHEKKENDNVIVSNVGNQDLSVECFLPNGWLVYTSEKDRKRTIHIYDSHTNKTIHSFDDLPGIGSYIGSRFLFVPLENGEFVYNWGQNLIMFDPSLMKPVVIVNDLENGRYIAKWGEHKIMTYEPESSQTKYRLIDLESKQTNYIDTRTEISSCLPDRLIDLCLRYLALMQNNIVTVNKYLEDQNRTANYFIKNWSLDGKLNNTFVFPSNRCLLDHIHHHDNRLIFVYSNYGGLPSGERHKLVVLDFDSKETNRFDVNLDIEYAIQNLQFFTNNIVVFSTADEYIQFLDLETNKKLFTMPMPRTRSMVVSPTGDVYCSTENDIRLIPHPLKELFNKYNKTISESSELQEHTLSRVVTEYLIGEREKFMGTTKPDSSDDTTISENPKKIR